MKFHIEVPLFWKRLHYIYYFKTQLDREKSFRADQRRLRHVEN